GDPPRLGRGIAGARPRSARLLALAFHRCVEGVGIDGDAARLERVLRQVERKAIGVVERERGLAVEPIALLEAPRLLVEDREPALERLAEAGLLELERLGNQ